MGLTSEVFSDIFARQDNRLARLDPRTKLVLAVAGLVCLIFSRQWFFPLTVMAGCIAATLAVRVPARLVLLRLAGPLGMAAMLLVLQLFLTGSTPLHSFAVLGWQVTATREGWHSGCLLASRMLAATSLLLLLSSVTPAHRLFCALRALGLPSGWVEVALLMYRYIFVFLDLAGDMMAAQRVRLGYAGIRRAWNSAGMAAGTVIVRSVDQAVHTHEAMVVRAYRGQMPFAPMPALPRREWGIIAGSGSLVIAWFWLMQVRLG
jgi:cobalt/nickel transport system permease protein